MNQTWQREIEVRLSDDLHRGESKYGGLEVSETQKLKGG